MDPFEPPRGIHRELTPELLRFLEKMKPRGVGEQQRDNLMRLDIGMPRPDYLDPEDPLLGDIFDAVMQRVVRAPQAPPPQRPAGDRFNSDAGVTLPTGGVTDNFGDFLRGLLYVFQLVGPTGGTIIDRAPDIPIGGPVIDDFGPATRGRATDVEGMLGPFAELVAGLLGGGPRTINPENEQYLTPDEQRRGWAELYRRAPPPGDEGGAPPPIELAELMHVLGMPPYADMDRGASMLPGGPPPEGALPPQSQWARLIRGGWRGPYPGRAVLPSDRHMLER